MWSLWTEITGRAVAAAWADMGTNGLGWLIALGSPVGAAMLSIAKLPGATWKTALLSKWRSELKNTVILAVSALVLIALWEATWNIPHQINKEARNATPELRNWPAPFAPNLPRIGGGSSQRQVRDNLRERTDGLAGQIIDFFYDRQGQITQWKQQAITQAMMDATFGTNNTPEFRRRLQAWNAETQEQFKNVYWPQVQSLMTELSSRKVDISPVTRAIATGDPRRVALMLSVVSTRIGKKAPFPRVFTPVEAKAMFEGTGRVKLEAYAESGDANSQAIAERMRVAAKQSGWQVDDKVQQISAGDVKLYGIHVVFPSGDLTFNFESMILTLQGCELDNTLDIRAARQPPTIIKIEVWKTSRPEVPQEGLPNFVLPKPTQ